MDRTNAPDPAAARERSAPRLRNGAVVVLAVLALGAGLAACSSEDGGDDSGSGSTGGDADDSTSVDLSVLGEPDPASGEPVVIGFGAGFEAEGQSSGAQEMLEGAEAAVAYQNEYRRGLGGRPIELVTCDMGALPETAIDCANQFVEQGVAAALLPVTSNGGSAVPIITGAGIPFVSFAATSFEELATEGAFSIAGGGIAALGSVAMDAENRGYSTVSHVLIDVPQITGVAAAVGDPLFAAAGVEQQIIPAPLGVPDLTAQLSTATGDAILISGDRAICASALQAYRTLGLDTPLYVQTTCITDDIAESIPDIYDGMYVATSLTNGGDDAELFAAMIEKYAPDSSLSREPQRAGQAAVGVSTVISFAGALAGIGDPTADAIAAGLESAGVQPLFLGEPTTFDCGEPILALASSLCSVQGHIVRLDASGDVTDSESFDPTELFETALAG